MRGVWKQTETCRLADRNHTYQVSRGARPRATEPLEPVRTKSPSNKSPGVVVDFLSPYEPNWRGTPSQIGRRSG